jgi:hypothetical protein
MLRLIFRLAQAAARRLRGSRSDLDRAAITECLNDVYSRHAARVDSALHRAQLKSLEKNIW